MVAHVSRAQRSTYPAELSEGGEVVRCRPGTPVFLARNRGPASAMHRFALHRARDTNA